MSDKSPPASYAEADTPVDIQQLRFDESFFSNIERWGEKLHADLQTDPRDIWKLKDFETYFSVLDAVRLIHEARKRGESGIKLNPARFKIGPKGGAQILQLEESPLSMVFRRENGEWVLESCRGRSGRYTPANEVV